MKKVLLILIATIALAGCSDDITKVYCCNSCDSIITIPHCPPTTILCIQGTKNARVCIGDDIYRGTIPFCVKVKAGEYESTAKKDSYRDWKGLIKTSCKDTVRVTIILRED